MGRGYLEISLSRPSLVALEEADVDRQLKGKKERGTRGHRKSLPVSIRFCLIKTTAVFNRALSRGKGKKVGAKTPTIGGTKRFAKRGGARSRNQGRSKEVEVEREHEKG